jgi:hypothetical protein
MMLTRANRWLLILSMAGTVAAAALLARHSMLAATHRWLERHYERQIAALSERQAVRLVRELARRDQPWIGVLLSASADDRVAVATTAESELRDLVERWSSIPISQISPQVAELASLLAVHAPRMPAERRHLAHALAERLIVWPVDGRQIDVARLIANCESVLLLPRTEPVEIRVAAAEPTPPVARIPAPSPLEADQSMPPVAAGAGTAAEPMGIPAVIGPPDNEPRRLIAPQGTRISEN